MEKIKDYGKIYPSVTFNGTWCDNTIKIDRQTVFMPYHTNITRRAHGIAIAHPPYCNNLLLPDVIEILKLKGDDIRGFVLYLVRNTVENIYSLI